MPETLSSADQRYLLAAIRIGAGGLGTTWPNPAVGAILVNDGRVVSVARTAAGGRPHAEQQALEAAGARAQGGTFYISLEPCAHHGRTPPCADAVVAAKVERVVVGTLDPDPRVSGKGIAKLEAAGIQVSLPLRQDKAMAANAGHFQRVRTGRPWITLKLAVSSDGMIGRKGAGQVAITGARASTHVHALRSRYDGILVGRGTVEADDPQLTCRLPGLEGRSPVRVVLDTHGRLRPDAKIFSATGSVPVLRLVGDTAPAAGADAFGEHVKTFALPVRDGRLDMKGVLDCLGDFGLTRVLVEGGSKIAASLIADGQVDDAIVFRSPNAIGSDGVPALADLDLSALEAGPDFRIVGRRRFGDDVMSRYQRAV
jgi:diaminohydroxyphosphoribosylaminopyrimidine deaminase/5-amino-6-(5-phosphoribosylamino)uracil reductase